MTATVCNPHGNRLCPRHAIKMITLDNGEKSGPWGVTCGYWRCKDDRCCLIDGESERYGFERREPI